MSGPSFGNELEFHVKNVGRDVWHLANVVTKLVTANPSPWSVFPDPPCEDIDTYLQLCCGLNRKHIAALMKMFGHNGLTNKTDLDVTTQ